MTFVLTALSILPALIQGGFYPLSFLSAGVLIGCFLIASPPHKMGRLEWLVWGFAGIYLIGSLVNGYDSASFSQACLPAVGACFLNCYVSFSPALRKKWVEQIVICSGILAFMGILALSGAIHLLGAVTARRLQYPFQYANAAGSWFASTALLSQGKWMKAGKRCRLLLLTALFLTRSVGAVGLYACCEIWLLFSLRKDAPHKWKEEIVTHVCTAILAGGCFFLSGWPVIIPCAGILLLSFVPDLLIQKAIRLRFHWLCLVVGLTICIWVLFSRRVTAARGTFIERIIQMIDGSSIIIKYPLFGIGAGNWQYIYRYFQTAQYTSTVVHSSLIQFGVDAGIFAIIAALLIVWSATKIKRGMAENAAMSLLLIHSIVDFTLQFYPIMILTLALMSAEETPLPPESKQPRITRQISLALIVLLFAGMFCMEEMAKNLGLTAQSDQWSQVDTDYERWRWGYGGNKEARLYDMVALSRSGDAQSILYKTENVYPLSEQEVLFRARALKNSGNESDAYELLLTELQRSPHCLSLFEKALALFEEWDVEQAVWDRYNEIVFFANESHTALGDWKGDQVYINQYREEHT